MTDATTELKQSARMMSLQNAMGIFAGHVVAADLARASEEKAAHLSEAVEAFDYIQWLNEPEAWTATNRVPAYIRIMEEGAAHCGASVRKRVQDVVSELKYMPLDKKLRELEAMLEDDAFYARPLRQQKADVMVVGADVPPQQRFHALQVIMQSRFFAELDDAGKIGVYDFVASEGNQEIDMTVDAFNASAKTLFLAIPLPTKEFALAVIGEQEPVKLIHSRTFEPDATPEERKPWSFSDLIDLEDAVTRPALANSYACYFRDLMAGVHPQLTEGVMVSMTRAADTLRQAYRPGR